MFFIQWLIEHVQKYLVVANSEVFAIKRTFFLSKRENTNYKKSGMSKKCDKIFLFFSDMAWSFATHIILDNFFFVLKTPQQIFKSIMKCGTLPGNQILQISCSGTKYYFFLLS